MRIIHAPEIVAGNSVELARAERSLGFQSEAISLRPHPFGYEGARIFVNKGAGSLAMLHGMLRMFFYILKNADVLHLNFGRSAMDIGPRLTSRVPAWSGIRIFLKFVQYLEFFIYRKAGISVFMTFQGSDARQGDVLENDGRVSMVRSAGQEYFSKSLDRIKRARIRFFGNHTAMILYLNPDLGRVLPNEAVFLPYGNVDWRSIGLVLPRNVENRVVVHAPSNRGTKGTEFVIGAVERLKRKGLNFKFVLVEGVARNEAMKMYEESDIVIDQLIAGWYGGFSVECMAMGKPVVAYLREEDFRFIPDGMREDLPLVNADPGSIVDVLEEMLTMPLGELQEVGLRSRAYVEKWHDPLAVAKQTLGFYQSEKCFGVRV